MVGSGIVSKPDCIAVWGNVHKSLLLVSCRDGNCRAVSLQNVPLGPTGRRLSVREFERGGDVPVAEGRNLAWNEGLLSVETLEVTPVKWAC